MPVNGNSSVAQWLSVLCRMGMLYPRASVQFLLRLSSGKSCAVQLVQWILVNPVDYLSGWILGILGVNLINEFCQNASTKGNYIQKKSTFIHSYTYEATDKSHK